MAKDSLHFGNPSHYRLSVLQEPNCPLQNLSLLSIDERRQALEETIEHSTSTQKKIRAVLTQCGDEFDRLIQEFEIAYQTLQSRCQRAPSIQLNSIIDQADELWLDDIPLDNQVFHLTVATGEIIGFATVYQSELEIFTNAPITLSGQCHHQKVSIRSNNHLHFSDVDLHAAPLLVLAKSLTLKPGVSVQADSLQCLIAETFINRGAVNVNVGSIKAGEITGTGAFTAEHELFLFSEKINVLDRTSFAAKNRLNFVALALQCDKNTHLHCPKELNLLTAVNQLKGTLSSHQLSIQTVDTVMEGAFYCDQLALLRADKAVEILESARFVLQGEVRHSAGLSYVLKGKLSYVETDHLRIEWLKVFDPNTHLDLRAQALLSMSPAQRPEPLISQQPTEPTVYPAHHLSEMYRDVARSPIDTATAYQLALQYNLDPEILLPVTDSVDVDQAESDLVQTAQVSTMLQPNMIPQTESTFEVKKPEKALPKATKLVVIDSKHSMEIKGSVKVNGASLLLRGKNEVNISGDIAVRSDFTDCRLLIESCQSIIQHQNSRIICDGMVGLQTKCTELAGDIRVYDTMVVKSKSLHLRPMAHLQARNLRASTKSFVADAGSAIDVHGLLCVDSDIIKMKGHINADGLMLEAEEFIVLCGQLKTRRTQLTAPVILSMARIQADEELVLNSYVSLITNYIKAGKLTNDTLLSLSLSVNNCLMSKPSKAAIGFMAINIAFAVTGIALPHLKLAFDAAQLVFFSGVRLRSLKMLFSSLQSADQYRRTQGTRVATIRELGVIKQILNTLFQGTMMGFSTVKCADSLLHHSFSQGESIAHHFEGRDIQSLCNELVSYISSCFSNYYQASIVNIGLNVTGAWSQYQTNLFDVRGGADIDFSNVHTGIWDIDATYSGHIGPSSSTGFRLDDFGIDYNLAGQNSERFVEGAVYDVFSLPEYQQSIQINALRLQNSIHFVKSTLQTSVIDFLGEHTEFDESALKADDVATHEAQTLAFHHSVFRADQLHNAGQLLATNTVVHATQVVNGAAATTTYADSNVDASAVENRGHEQVSGTVYNVTKHHNDKTADTSFEGSRVSGNDYQNEGSTTVAASEYKVQHQSNGSADATSTAQFITNQSIVDIDTFDNHGAEQLIDTVGEVKRHDISRGATTAVDACTDLRLDQVSVSNEGHFAERSSKTQGDLLQNHGDVVVDDSSAAFKHVTNDPKASFAADHSQIQTQDFQHAGTEQLHSCSIAQGDQHEQYGSDGKRTDEPVDTQPRFDKHFVDDRGLHYVSKQPVTMYDNVFSVLPMVFKGSDIIVAGKAVKCNVNLCLLADSVVKFSDDSKIIVVGKLTAHANQQVVVGAADVIARDDVVLSGDKKGVYAKARVVYHREVHSHTNHRWGVKHVWHNVTEWATAEPPNICSLSGDVTAQSAHGNVETQGANLSAPSKGHTVHCLAPEGVVKLADIKTHTRHYETKDSSFLGIPISKGTHQEELVESTPSALIADHKVDLKGKLVDDGGAYIATMDEEDGSVDLEADNAHLTKQVLDAKIVDKAIGVTLGKIAGIGLDALMQAHPDASVIIQDPFLQSLLHLDGQKGLGLAAAGSNVITDGVNSLIRFSKAWKDQHPIAAASAQVLTGSSDWHVSAGVSAYHDEKVIHTQQLDESGIKTHAFHAKISGTLSLANGFQIVADTGRIDANKLVEHGVLLKTSTSEHHSSLGVTVDKDGATGPTASYAQSHQTQEQAVDSVIDIKQLELNVHELNQHGGEIHSEHLSGHVDKISSESLQAHEKHSGFSIGLSESSAQVGWQHGHGHEVQQESGVFASDSRGFHAGEEELVGARADGIQADHVDRETVHDHSSQHGYGLGIVLPQAGDFFQQSPVHYDSAISYCEHDTQHDASEHRQGVNIDWEVPIPIHQRPPSVEPRPVLRDADTVQTNAELDTLVDQMLQALQLSDMGTDLLPMDAQSEQPVQVAQHTNFLEALLNALVPAAYAGSASAQIDSSSQEGLDADNYNPLQCYIRGLDGEEAEEELIHSSHSLIEEFSHALSRNFTYFISGLSLSKDLKDVYEDPADLHNIFKLIAGSSGIAVADNLAIKLEQYSVAHYGKLFELGTKYSLLSVGGIAVTELYARIACAYRSEQAPGGLLGLGYMLLNDSSALERHLVAVQEQTTNDLGKLITAAQEQTAETSILEGQFEFLHSLENLRNLDAALYSDLSHMTDSLLTRYRPLQELSLLDHSSVLSTQNLNHEMSEVIKAFPNAEAAIMKNDYVAAYSQILEDIKAHSHVSIRSNMALSGTSAALGAVSLALAVKQVFQSDHKVKEAVHQSLLASAAMFGAQVGSRVVAAAVCTSTGPICAIGVTLGVTAFMQETVDWAWHKINSARPTTAVEPLIRQALSSNPMRFQFGSALHSIRAPLESHADKRPAV